jgi:tetratricopeptide (TPR) repeat protein
VTEPAAFSDAVALIRSGQTDLALNLLRAALVDLPAEDRPTAHKYAGLACYFAARWGEALEHFQQAAEGSEIPEDHFNVAMSQVRLGQIEQAHATWQRVFDLSYAHQDAPESSSFFEKKLLFARSLREAGACDARGLDLVARQLMGFFTTNHITDASFWGIRRVPPFEAVLETTRDFYRAMGKTEGEWHDFLNGIAPQVDEEGREYIESMREGYGVRSEE